MNQFSPPLFYLNLETWVWSLGQGRPHGEGTSNPLQYCLANPMDRGAWWAAVHGVAKSRTRQSNFPFFHFSLSRIGEGNGNPLQCSCLEYPRDGGAWRASIYGVAQTRLKRLCSSSSKHPYLSFIICEEYNNDIFLQGHCENLIREVIQFP